MRRADAPDERRLRLRAPGEQKHPLAALFGGRLEQMDSSKSTCLLVSVVVLCALVVVVGVTFTACGGTYLDSAEVGARALGALESVSAWRIETTSADGWTEVEWWSAQSRDYRWDEIVKGTKRSSVGTDGKVLIAPGPDGAVADLPLGSAAGHVPNPTVFTTYYSYLKQGKPLEAELASDGSVRLILKDAPSSLSARLSADSYLPVEFLGASEMTGVAGSHEIQMVPISQDALGQSIAELRQTPPPTFPNATPEDHMLHALRAADIDCYDADTYTTPENKRILELSIQPPIGRADHDQAVEVAEMVRTLGDVLSVDALTVYLLTSANEYYSENFSVD